MIEPVEQQVLETLARTMALNPGDVIVEFGPFMGRSTACLASGLISNQTFSEGIRVVTYDSFQCSTSSQGFFSQVRKHADRFNVGGLLIQQDDYVDFQPVFEHFLSGYITAGLVVPKKFELIDSVHSGEVIRILHIDSPKWFSELKIILARFFPSLALHSAVIFQDFFYQWSATIIAAIEAMIERGFLDVRGSAASSLICQVTKTLKNSDVLEIDFELQKHNAVPRLIDSAIERMDAIDIDRRDIFQPRLKLAKMQWLFENGRQDEAADTIIEFVNSGGSVNSNVASCFLELMRSGFSVRSSYKIDHPV